MRFLLHPNLPRSARGIARKNGDKRNRYEQAVLAVSNNVSTNDSAPHLRSWGQQCSPTCGCVVRFEAKVDPSTQIIIDSHYLAKSVVATPSKDSNQLEPVLTTRTQKPMFRDCNCNTVHTLAKEITSFLPNRKLDKVRNMTEFTFTRSSTAFRHAVLVENNLPRNDTHCFDIVEEAFTAMIKGNMLKHRRNKKDFQHTFVAEMRQIHQSEKGSEEIGMDQRRLSLSSPRSMSTLKMFDINNEYWENEYEQYLYDADDSSEVARNKLDWVSYVDEKYENEESA
jgi:NifU-like protein involved in Fe-S cluster formation